LAQDGGAGVDHHVVLDDRMARLLLEQGTVPIEGKGFGAQGYGLVWVHPIAGYGRAADHHAGAIRHAGAMVDKKLAPITAPGRQPNADLPPQRVQAGIERGANERVGCCPGQSMERPIRLRYAE
jgi:hypothetical protein